MTDIYKNFHTETIEGFEVRLRFEDEHINPVDLFDEDDLQSIQAVYDGNVTWLIAIVEVFKCGVELGYASLGPISYEWHKLDDFIKERFYDMANEAIEDAKLKLNELLAA